MASNNKMHHEGLGGQVEERTAGLIKLNDELQREVAERRLTEDALKERTHILTAMLEVSNHVVSSLDLESLLSIILDQLNTIVEYDMALVFSLKGEFLVPLVYKGPSTLEEVLTKNISGKQTLSRSMIDGKKPVIIDDVHGNEDLAHAFRDMTGEQIEATLFNIHSWVGVPLMIKNQAVGILSFGHKAPGYYTQRHAGIALAFANQAAVAMENARLYAETRQRADELQTMFAVQQAITSRLELDSVLQLIANEARRLTDSRRTAVFLAEGDALRISVIAGDDDSGLLGYKMPIDQSLTGLSLRMGRPVRVNSAQSNPAVYSEIVQLARVESFLSVPLISGTQLIGAISVVDKLSGTFETEDERVLSMLASIAVIGLENARMYREEQKRHYEDEQHRKVAEGLRDILAKLNSNSSLAEILEYIITQAGRLLGTDTVALYRLQADKGLLSIKAARGLPEKYVSRMTIPVGQGVVGKAVLERRPVIAIDMSGLIPDHFVQDPERYEHLAWLANNYNGVVAVPLIGKDEIYGGIVLYYPKRRELSEEEIELAMSFANQAVLAINNARLRAKVEENAVAAERSRLARDLHDAVTQTLFSASLIAEVLPKIWERNPGEVRRRLDELRQLTRGALAEMRTLLLELRPATLVELGLKDLLHQLTEGVMGRARIPITFKVEGQPVLPSEAKIAIYRIAQEALNNIAKHSGATQVTVSLTAVNNSDGQAEQTELHVIDNGHGFDKSIVPPDHLGLSIMRERAEAIGAQLQIESQIGKGTEVSVIWVNKKGD